MARIPEYIAPTTQLRPEGRGFGAFEAGGRRLGGLADEAARARLRAGSEVARGLEAAAVLQARQPLVDAQIASLKSRLAFMAEYPGNRGGGARSARAAARSSRTGSSANDLAHAAASLAALTGPLSDYYGPPGIALQESTNRALREASPADRYLRTPGGAGNERYLRTPEAPAEVPYYSGPGGEGTKIDDYSPFIPPLADSPNPFSPAYGPPNPAFNSPEPSAPSRTWGEFWRDQLGFSPPPTVTINPPRFGGNNDAYDPGYSAPAPRVFDDNPGRVYRDEGPGWVYGQ